MTYDDQTTQRQHLEQSQPFSSHLSYSSHFRSSACERIVVEANPQPAVIARRVGGRTCGFVHKRGHQRHALLLWESSNRGAAAICARIFDLVGSNCRCKSVVTLGAKRWALAPQLATGRTRRRVACIGRRVRARCAITGPVRVAVFHPPGKVPVP